MVQQLLGVVTYNPAQSTTIILTSLDRCIRILVIFPYTTSNCPRNSNPNTNGCTDDNQSDQDLNPDFGFLVHAGHTSADSMLSTLSPHSFLLHLHRLLTWPNCAVHVLSTL